MNASIQRETFLLVVLCTTYCQSRSRELGRYKGQHAGNINRGDYSFDHHRNNDVENAHSDGLIGEGGVGFYGDLESGRVLNDVDSMGNTIVDGGSQMPRMDRRDIYEYEHDRNWIGRSRVYTIHENSPTLGCNVRDNKIASCQNGLLTEVPQDLPTSITTLLLRNNLISTLPDHILSRYINLTKLDISYNKIQSLSDFSFSGLDILDHLDLAFNQLLYRNKNFPSVAFRPLLRLTHLNISGNNPNCTDPRLSYPHVALSQLKSLSVLRMDGLLKPNFGIGFQNMTSLRKVYVNGYHGGFCNMKELRNDTFQYLIGLTTLHLQSCFITGKYLDKRAFLPLTQLKELSLEHNEDIGVENLESIFYGLQNAANLETLNLHLVINRYSLGICLDSKLIKAMPKSIKHLSVQENNLAAIDRSVIDTLPPGLKFLDLSGNHFVFGTYLKDLHKMKSLETININGGSFRYKIPSIYPYDQPTSETIPTRTNLKPAGCSLYNAPNENPISKFVLTFPPNLKTINMTDAGLVYILSKWVVDAENVVDTILLGRNNFNMLDGPIIGFNKLRVLDLSSCFVESISTKFFDNMTSLETLKLQGNLLGRHLKGYTNDTVFSKLRNLRHLDLGFNAIDYLPRNAFEGLDNLENLCLDENAGLITFNVDISHMKKLKYLSLRRTQLGFLPEQTTSHIDALLRSNIFVRINMADSPILCTCKHLGFLQWMTKSGAFDRTFPCYECNYHDFTRKRLVSGYNQTISLLKRECTSHSLEFFIAGGLSACVVIMMGVIFCYQFRWKIRYLYYSAYLNFKKDPDTNKKEFRFDVFISYACEDGDVVLRILEPELKRRNLRILIHERDFPAGEYIASNIVKAICQSKKTLVLLTQSMLKSYWCKYEIQMANVEAMQTGRRVLLFLIKGPTPQRKDNLEVFYNIKNNTYCDFPDDAETNEARLKCFWDKLARDILS